MEVPDSLAGKTEKCFNCGQLIDVPDQVSELPAPKPLATEHVPPPHAPEKATGTEILLAFFGVAIAILGALVAFACMIGAVSGHSSATGVVVGLAMMLNAVPIFALHHVLRYLRIIASRTKA